MPKIILIVGGGYAGVAAAKGLIRRRVDARIIFVDQNSYHALPSDYYELATTNLSEKKPIDWDRVKQSAAIPFAAIFAHATIEIRKDCLERVDLARNVCVFAQGGEQSYDYLLLALGTETNFYNIPRLQEYAHGFKTISDVLEARNDLDELFTRKAKHEPIQIVIGGGGFTGCEVAAELMGFIKKLAYYHSHPLPSITITVIEAGNSLLPGGSPWLQTAAKKHLEALGIHIIFEKPIKSITAREVLFDGFSLPYDILFWTAGVKPNTFFDQWLHKGKEKICVVDQTLRLPNHQNIFVLGDAAYCPNPATGKPEPMTGQVALRHGTYAAETIAALLENRVLKPYRHKNPLLLVPLGGKYALLDLGWIRIRGFMGWILKRAALLRYLLSILPLYKAIPFWLSTTRLFTKND
ncbi:MAG: FAD-dependent oxidoreductase [Candidatus Colwellbacteria bacterium]|nr:FAD-dependent oxidoreductase [Candidatus Colwellbacteria bacterium]